MNKGPLDAIPRDRKQWVNGRGGKRADLRKVDLSGADLHGADLSRAKCRGATFVGANLHGANLRGANLSEANLSSCRMRGACLADAHLKGAELSGSDLGYADLSRANLSGANLTGSMLSGANLYNATLTKVDPRLASFVRTGLAFARLSEIRVNRQSHDLVAKILWDNARGDVDKERWIAWMREHRELCWSAFFRSVPADIVQWACSTLAPWMRNDDELPEPFQTRLERTKA